MPGTDRLELPEGAVPNPAGLTSTDSRDQRSWVIDNTPYHTAKETEPAIQVSDRQGGVVSDGGKRIIRLCYYNFCSPFERQGQNPKCLISNYVCIPRVVFLLRNLQKDSQDD